MADSSNTYVWSRQVVLFLLQTAIDFSNVFFLICSPIGWKHSSYCKSISPTCTWLACFVCWPFSNMSNIFMWKCDRNMCSLWNYYPGGQRRKKWKRISTFLSLRHFHTDCLKCFSEFGRKRESVMRGKSWTGRDRNVENPVFKMSSRGFKLMINNWFALGWRLCVLNMRNSKGTMRQYAETACGCMCDFFVCLLSAETTTHHSPLNWPHTPTTHISFD